MLETGAHARQRSAVILCPAATSSYDSLVFGTQITKTIMKPEKIACINVFGEHLHAWSGRRAQDQTLRWRACVAPSYRAMRFDRALRWRALSLRMWITYAKERRWARHRWYAHVRK
jgi:hypothetical protein